MWRSIISSTYSLHVALHTSLTTTEGFLSNPSGVLHVTAYLAPASRWRRVAANLRLRFQGFMFKVCFSRHGPYWICHLTIHLGCRGYFEGSRIFFSEFNNELVIDLSGCSLVTNSGSSSPPKPASDELVDDNMLLSWKKTSWCVIAATYCGPILTRE